MLATTHGRAQRADMELAVQADGTITGLKMRVLADLGAYPLATWLPWLTGRMAVGVYRIPAVEINPKYVHTHTTPVAAYRGAGRPEAAYYIERMIDLVAFELGLDPVEVRRKNFIPPDQFPYNTPTGATYDSGDYEKALAKALEVARYDDLRAEQAGRSPDDPSLMGIGVATFVETCAPGPYESAVVRVDPTGVVTVLTGIMPHGRATRPPSRRWSPTRSASDFDKVIVKYGDTASGPMGIGTYGSRGMAVGGMAVLKASTRVREKAQQIAAHMLEAAVEDIVLAGGQLSGARRAQQRPQSGADRRPRLQRSTAGGDRLRVGSDGFLPSDRRWVYPFGAHVAVVEIERDTGIVHLRDYISVEDCGPRISPLLVEGQVHGGLAQGIGQALLEEMVYDEQGQLLTGSLMDYAIPRADSFPHFRPPRPKRRRRSIRWASRASAKRRRSARRQPSSMPCWMR